MVYIATAACSYATVITQTINYIMLIEVNMSCNMGMRDLPDMYAQGLRAYITGKSRLPMLQVRCITSATLKICPNKIKTHNHIDLLRLYKVGLCDNSDNVISR